MGPIRSVEIIAEGDGELEWTFFDPTENLARGVWEILFSSISYESLTSADKTLRLECDLVKGYTYGENLEKVFGCAPLHYLKISGKKNVIYPPKIWFEVNNLKPSSEITLYKLDGSDDSIDSGIKCVRIILMYRKKYE